MTIVNMARRFAKEAHQGQLYGKLPFFIHCKQTALILQAVTNDQNLIAAGYLHDIFEDTFITYEQLTNYFGEDISSLVKEVTKTSYNVFPFLHSRRGIMLKFADRLSNLSNIDSWPVKRQEAYLKKSQFWKI
jgi:(p)ppGpp synthase/HD superfamily hydrolase